MCLRVWEISWSGAEGLQALTPAWQQWRGGTKTGVGRQLQHQAMFEWAAQLPGRCCTASPYLFRSSTLSSAHGACSPASIMPRSLRCMQPLQAAPSYVCVMPNVPHPVPVRCRRALLAEDDYDADSHAHGGGGHNHPFPMGMLVVVVGFSIMLLVEHLSHAVVLPGCADTAAPLLCQVQSAKHTCQGSVAVTLDEGTVTKEAAAGDEGESGGDGRGTHTVAVASDGRAVAVAMGGDVSHDQLQVCIAETSLQGIPALASAAAASTCAAGSCGQGQEAAGQKGAISTIPAGSGGQSHTSSGSSSAGGSLSATRLVLLVYMFELGCIFHRCVCA